MARRFTDDQHKREYERYQWDNDKPFHVSFPRDRQFDDTQCG